MKKKVFQLIFIIIFVFSSGELDSFAKKKSKYHRSKLTSDKTEVTADRRRLKLTTGEDKIVDLDFDVEGGANAVAVGNPKVAVTTTVSISGKRRQIVFKPLSAGTTTVAVRDSAGKVRVIFDVEVTGSNLLKIAGEIRSLLKDVEGLQIRIVGSKIVIDGEILVPGDYGRIVNVIGGKTSPYADQVINLTKLSPLALQILSKRIESDIKKFAENITTRVVNGTVWLEGNVSSKGVADRAFRVAKLYLPELRPGDPLEKDPTVQRLSEPRRLIQSFLVIDPPAPKKTDKLVRVTVHFVELSKDYNKVFGFKWQPGFTTDPQIQIGGQVDGTTGAQGIGTFTATLSSLFPKLQSAQNSGFARILKSGTVIVKSNTEAKLNDSTVIPYAVAGPNQTVATNEVPVGLAMSITPTVLGSTEDVRMHVNLKQSNLTGRTTSGAPITANHEVNTLLYLKSRESAAVAGVESTDVMTGFNKDDPNSGSFSGDTSPLFTLLRSKSYTKKKSRFVIFVTPEIVSNASDGTKDLKKNFRVKID